MRGGACASERKEYGLVDRDEIPHFAIAPNDPAVRGRLEGHEAHLLGRAPHGGACGLELRPRMVDLAPGEESAPEQRVVALELLPGVTRLGLQLGHGGAEIDILQPRQDLAFLHVLAFIRPQLDQAAGHSRGDADRDARLDRARGIDGLHGRAARGMDHENRGGCEEPQDQPTRAGRQSDQEKQATGPLQEHTSVTIHRGRVQNGEARGQRGSYKTPGPGLRVPDKEPMDAAVALFGVTVAAVHWPEPGLTHRLMAPLRSAYHSYPRGAVAGRPSAAQRFV